MDIIFSRPIVDYISGYGKSYQLHKCNHSDILPSTTSRRVVINLKVNTSIAIISIYIPVELTFDTTSIESKGLFDKIKKMGKLQFFLNNSFPIDFQQKPTGKL